MLPLKDLDRTCEVKKMHDKVGDFNGRSDQKVLVVEEKPKSHGKEWIKWYANFIVQVQI